MLLYLPTNSQIISKSWKSDIKYLKDTLPQKHKNLYFKITPTEFNNYLDSLINEMDTLQHDNFIISLQELFAKIGDSHTTFFWKGILFNQKLIPMKLEWFSDGIYIIEINEENKSLLGCKLLSINNVSIYELINKFQKLIVVDNDAIVKYELPQILNIGELYSYFKISNNTDTLLITGQNSNGDIISRKVILVNKSTRMKSIKIKNIPISFKNTNKLFWYSTNLSDSLLFVQYNQCTGKEVWKKYIQLNKRQIRDTYGFFLNIIFRTYLDIKVLATPSFEKFANKIYKKLNKSSIKEIVVDLRYNGGGSSMQGTIFIDSLSKFPKVKMYGLIGRKTFSSGVINAIDLKNNNAVLLGENTGGMANHYGDIKYFILPNTRVQINYSTKYFNLSDKYSKTIFPDLILENSFKDYVNGQDPCLNYLIK